MRTSLVSVLALGLLVACQDAPIEPQLDDNVALTSADARKGPKQVTYAVTVTNLTTGQPFTPPVAITHHNRFDVFSTGHAASPEVQAIAENGNIQPLVDLASASNRVAEVVVAAGPVPPILPGESRTFEINGAPSARRLSIVSMLICSNDGFTGLDAPHLNGPVGSSWTWYASAYDAGTEENTESFADLVPPCPALTGVPSSVPGTGMSNPLLATSDPISMHPGVAGLADLQPGLHGWSGPVAMITATRIR